MAEEKSAGSSPNHASCSKPEESTGNWWDSWISSAKSKSAEVYSMVKKDLDEIGSAVKCEANLMLSTTSEAIGKTLKLDEPESPANVMKKSISSFIGQVSTALSPEPDDEDTEVILSSGDTTLYSTYKRELEALQGSDATYLVPAAGASFAAWHSARAPPPPAALARRLAASAQLRAQHHRLVPRTVDDKDFWERYLFRVAELQDRLALEARAARAPAPAPAAPETAPATPDTAPAPLAMHTAPIIDQSPKKVMPDAERPAERPADWQAEDFAADLELSEEQQTLLLEEYEKEIASKKHTKTSRNKPSRRHNQRKAADKTSDSQELVEDHFAETPKDDVSSNSDESWEKDFEIDNVQKA